MEELKYLMGHGSIGTTSDTYGHLFKAAKDALAHALEATFQSSLRAETDDQRTTFASRPLRKVT
jgi:hypothetical protein